MYSFFVRASSLTAQEGRVIFLIELLRTSSLVQKVFWLPWTCLEIVQVTPPRWPESRDDENAALLDDASASGVVGRWALGDDLHPGLIL